MEGVEDDAKCGKGTAEKLTVSVCRTFRRRANKQQLNTQSGTGQKETATWKMREWSTAGLRCVKRAFPVCK